jgi:hypothetical protein
MLGMRAGSRLPSISKPRYTPAPGLYNATAARELWILASLYREGAQNVFVLL